MTTLAAERTMPKRSSGPKRNDIPVKMDAEVARKAKIVAAYRDQSLAEFISKELGSIVDRLLEEEHSREVRGPMVSKAPKGKGAK